MDLISLYYRSSFSVRNVNNNSECVHSHNITGNKENNLVFEMKWFEIV